jgi:hypothetical protein
MIEGGSVGHTAEKMGLSRGEKKKAANAIYRQRKKASCAGLRVQGQGSVPGLLTRWYVNVMSSHVGLRAHRCLLHCLHSNPMPCRPRMRALSWRLPP